MFEQKLEVFKTVADCKNITLAAKKMHMSQSSISLQIQSLEEQFGARFLDRTNRGVSLTRAGHVFYQYVCSILEVMQEIQQKVTLLSEDKRRYVNLGATLTIGEYIMPQILVYLYKQWPDINFKTVIANTETISQGILDRKIHVGLIEGPVSPNRLLKIESFWRDELVVVVPFHHPWAERDSVSLAELSKERFITREVGSGTRKVTENYLKELGLDPAVLNISMELGSTQAIKQVVSAGLGITVISYLTVRKECEQRIFKALRIEDFPLWRPLNILTLEKNPQFMQSQDERHFIDFLHNEELLAKVLTSSYSEADMTAAGSKIMQIMS
ncbi:HTH-type transcriptional regulator CysL [Peptococcaceae bacterium CEB3]|nr:HTH-type transcriptional regulator CysL [Peptococcaceae bacterium CEB3]